MNKKQVLIMTIIGALLAIFAPTLLKKYNEFLAGALAGFGAVFAVFGLILISFKKYKK
ncbi:MAG: hypothetical protein WCG87_03955 [Bacteroidota bacterium]